jgi:serine/threonine protein kinase
MVSPKSIGKYRVSRTIGEGTFSKVKLAFNSNNGEKVAIKVIDKQMVLKNNLKYQVNLILILVLPLQKVIICLLMLHY